MRSLTTINVVIFFRGWRVALFGGEFSTGYQNGCASLLTIFKNPRWCHKISVKRIVQYLISKKYESPIYNRYRRLIVNATYDLSLNIFFGENFDGGFDH